MRDDFAIFILTHGRPHNQYTLQELQKRNYPGKWYLIIDNEDDTADEYFRLYGKDHVVQFDRIAQYNRHDFDIGDNFNSNRNTIVYARNMCFPIAEQLGLKYFWEFEDDYTDFTTRIQITKDNLTQIYVEDFEAIVNALIDFIDSTNVTTIAMSQVGDWLGGVHGQMFKEKIKRKAMNTFLCRVDRPFTFLGRMNDDVNTYVVEGSRGMIFLTIRDLIMRQLETQKNTGGNTEMYLNFGTYIKSFYSVMMAPSCVSISCMGQTHRRIHHHIDWNTAVPKIISSKFKV